ncbi:hypothetical protein CBS147343_2798 [Aspergillus niger]|nr:hypothetical protein CBS133816_9742 [Aspergillus niger]KAI2846542.1 hypothetical protein CBS11350_3575 [Aspergillus niger]KAI2949054.1 hypothetical protein CBS147322_6060 [Aspergillus niger]KAI2976189.1 hypothetical protein CBS147324_2589 [Aspergillus niger]KAI2981767.1 hypothetical protein CBS147344_9221 [Aspergillus niger]
MIPSHFKISPNDGVIGSEAEARGVVVKVMIFVSSPHQPDSVSIIRLQSTPRNTSLALVPARQCPSGIPLHRGRSFARA